MTRITILCSWLHYLRADFWAVTLCSARGYKQGYPSPLCREQSTYKCQVLSGFYCADSLNSERTSRNYIKELLFEAGEPVRNPWEPPPIITIEARANQEKLLTKPNLEAVEKRSRGHEKSRSELSRKCRAPPRLWHWPLRPACSSGLIIALCGRVPVVAHSRVFCERCYSSVERRRLCLQAWRSDLGAGQNDYTKLYRFYFKV